MIADWPDRLDDVIRYSGAVVPRRQALADLQRHGVSAAWIDRTMREAEVVTFSEPVRDAHGRFAPGAAAESGGSPTPQLADQRPVASYDFDGTLHRTLRPGTRSPRNFFDWQSWEPFHEVHQQLSEDAKTHKVIVVSKRDDEHKDAMWQFVKHHNLPVEEVRVTNNQPKGPHLTRIPNLRRHYDDDPGLEQQLAGSGIDFVRVHPEQR